MINAASPNDPAEPAVEWFALYTVARHEKRVAQHLGQRGIKFFLPSYRAHRKWRDGSRVALDLPLFPGYLFVNIRRPDRVRVLQIPSALALVMGTGGQPAPLPDTVIEALQSGLELQGAEPHPLLIEGQRVRIRAGAFAGIEGVMIRSKNHCRVVLTVEHIMRSFSVELDLANLESILSAETTVAIGSATSVG